MNCLPFASEQGNGMGMFSPRLAKAAGLCCAYLPRSFNLACTECYCYQQM